MLVGFSRETEPMGKGWARGGEAGSWLLWLWRLNGQTQGSGCCSSSSGLRAGDQHPSSKPGREKGNSFLLRIVFCSGLWWRLRRVGGGQSLHSVCWYAGADLTWRYPHRCNPESCFNQMSGHPWLRHPHSDSLPSILSCSSGRITDPGGSSLLS